MRVLLLGAGGFIGRHIMAKLLADGHDLTAIVRSSGSLPKAFPKARFTALDLNHAVRKEDWLPHLADIDCIVNSAGILHGRAMDKIHVQMPRALYAAAQQAGVKRAILISAISAREDVETAYSSSKLAGEDVLRQSALQWTILRPSLVYGDGSYGGTSLIRGMSALPLITPLPGKGDFTFSPIHVADLARDVEQICSTEGYAGQTLEACGPQTLSLKDILGRYRKWLGLEEPRFLPIPMAIMGLMGRLGDLTGDGPVSSTSLKQMVAGNAGNGAAYQDAIGLRQRSFDEALQARPSQVQDRWHARLFFLAPAVKAVLVLLWAASAFLGVLYGAQAASSLLASLGLPQSWVPASLILGSIIDLAVAAIVLLDRKARAATIVQLAVVTGYTIILTIGLPQLWLDPLGSLLKNIPILLLIAVHSVIGDRR